MKREFITGLLPDIDKGVLDQIMAEHGKGINDEKTKVTAKDAELVAANATIKGLQDTVKKFDGVDIEKLKTDAQTWETKYNTDINAERAKAETLVKEYGLKDALKAQGVNDPEYLIFKQGGVEKFAFADNKPVGLDDIIKPYKESSPHLFAQQQQQTKPNTGMTHQGGSETTTSRTGQANEALRSAFGKGI